MQCRVDGCQKTGSNIGVVTSGPATSELVSVSKCSLPTNTYSELLNMVSVHCRTNTNSELLNMAVLTAAQTPNNCINKPFLSFNIYIKHKINSIDH